MNYKKVLGVGVTSMMLFSVISPTFALAEGMEKKATNFCDGLSILEAKNAKKIENKKNKIDIKREEKNLRMKDNWATFDAKREMNRSKEEANRTEKMAKKENKLDTDAEKEKMMAFKTSIENATQTRKEAVDSAVKAYRDGTEKIMKERKTMIDGITGAYKNAITEALAKAKADCASGIDSKTVATTFRTAQNVAKEKMKTDRMTAEKISEEVKNLVEVRKQAVEKARTDFKMTTEKAREALKNSLNKTQ